MTAYLKVLLPLILILSSAGYSFQTSSESVNPFNQFMSPSGGVNLYSGDAALSYPICAVKGRNGLDASVSLSYSSNIYLNVRSRNDIAPAGWCGLGWNLNYGAIYCDHKGTKTHADDEFTWRSPAGFGSKILNKNGKFYIKDDPYTKVEPQDVNSDGIYDGWILTSVDGTKMKYGNLNLSGNRNATRWTFAWGNFVGVGRTGTPTLFPYQWDISEIADLSGNPLKFYYSQKTEQLKSNTWVSSVQYTKASYIDSIVTPEGKRIEFVLQNKGDEAFDPFIFQSEPDGFMEMYEDSLLSQVKVFNVPGSTTPVSIYKFAYNTINGVELGAAFKKSLLMSIETWNGTATTQMGKTVFTYNTDYNKGNKDDATRYDANYNYGAIAKISTLQGGATEYSYTRQDLPYTRVNMFGRVNTHKDLFFGTLKDGRGYCVVIYGNGDSLAVYNWDGGNWRNVASFAPEGLGNYGYDVKTGNGFFAVIGRVYKDKLWLYEWDDSAWQLRLDAIAPGGYGDGYNLNVAIGSDQVGIACGKQKDLVCVYSKIGTSWIRTMDYITNPPWGKGAHPCYLSFGSNFLSIVTGYSQDQLFLYNWNGSSWSAGQYFEPDGTNGNKKNLVASSNDNTCVISGGEYNDKIWIYQWNGQTWSCLNIFVPDNYGPPNKNLFAQCGGNFLAITGGANHDKIWRSTWDGSNWSLPTDVSPEPLGNNKSYTASLGNDFFVVSGGDNCDKVYVFRKNGVSWLPTESYCPDGCTGENKHIRAYVGMDFFSVEGGVNTDKVWVFTWNGQVWKNEWYSSIGHLNEAKYVRGGLTAFGVRCGEGGDNFWLFNKFQDNFNTPIFSYIANKKTLYDGLGKSIITNFVFNQSTGNYDTRAGTAKYNKVETIIPNSGKTVQYFFNDISSADNQGAVNASYDKLDGIAYRTAAFNQANVTSEAKVLSSGSTTYSLFSDASWPPDVYQKRVSKTTSSTQGVSSINEILGYNNVNGLPYLTRTSNSDGKYKLAKTLFAYEQSAYSAMGTSGAFMLTQPCQTIVYETSESSPSNARSSQATRWSNASGVWCPCSTYAWKTAMTGTGAASTPLPTFNFADPSANDLNVWKFTGGMTKYNSYGQVNETKNALNVPSTTIYGTAGSLPIGSIAPAKFEECGVFTCDYDLNQGDYFDQQNGWEKMHATIASNPTHFGQKSVLIDFPAGSMKYGPTRNFVIERGKDYIMSAWVLVQRGTLVISGDYRWVTNGNSVPTQLTGFKKGISSANDPIVASESWQFVSKKIPASTDLTPTDWSNSSSWGVRIGVGFGELDPVNGVKAYIDDIRFYPAKSLVTTTYYDTTWQQPILTVDASNLPGKLVKYDEFGRPIEWYEIDRNQSRGADVLLQSKSYFLTGNIYAIKADANGKYVSATNNGAGTLIANKTAITGSEKFQITDLGSGNISIKAFINNKYVCADNAGVSPLIANRTTCGNWETYQKIDAGSGKVYLKALANQKYVCADNGGANPLIANQTSTGTSVTFTLIAQ